MRYTIGISNVTYDKLIKHELVEISVPAGIHLSVDKHVPVANVLTPYLQVNVIVVSVSDNGKAAFVRKN